MLLTDKDKNILAKFLQDEDNEMAIRKIVIESVANAGVEITVRGVQSIFDQMESIISDYLEPEEEDESK